MAFRRLGCDDETEFYAELLEQGAQRELLAETADLDQLNAWLMQAVTSTRAGELFD
ncbi:hypothetical protein ACFWUP_15320 [Nocardia sp. NPDC058658]|uniref:hypothetical protein n=1 Tax=Nocardia sp. NPDC058658 TaxID=3346580 RepID=UPI003653B14E